MRRPRVRIWLLGILLTAPLVRGCTCSCNRRAPLDPALQARLRAQLESKVVDAGAPAASAQAASDDPFSIERRRIEFWEAYEEKKYAYVIADAIALLNAGVDEEFQCELWLILSEAYGQTGDTERAKEASAKFRELLDKLRASPRYQGEAKQLPGRIAAVQQLIARKTHAAFLWPDGERRMSDVLWDKLKDAGPDEVVETVLEDQTPVVISKNAEKLAEHLTSASGDQPQVCREPEHGFYYAIREQK